MPIQRREEPMNHRWTLDDERVIGDYLSSPYRKRNLDTMESEPMIADDLLTISLLCKLGSIARHADEATGPTANPADFQAIRGLLDDPEVSEWMAQLDALALLPVKR